MQSAPDAPGVHVACVAHDAPALDTRDAPEGSDNERHRSAVNFSGHVSSADLASGVVDSQSSRELPSFSPAPMPTFKWGSLDGPDIAQVISASYAEAVCWRRNVFAVPSGKAGKEFVLELARLFRAYAEGSALESIALKAAMVMPQLLLQKPSLGSKARDHAACLERRLRAWKEADIDGLVREARTIQGHLAASKRRMEKDHTAHTFAKLMMVGKVHAALRLISQEGGGGLLSLDEEIAPGGITVRDVLKEKHPAPQPPYPDTLLPPCENRLDVHPVLFDRIDGAAIRAVALRSTGSAGPSGVDASGWRRLCVSFHGASKVLCDSVAQMTRRLCTEHVDPVGIQAFIACRLIPLDKRPGVRPIGIGETLRRIIGKAVLKVVGPDVRAVTGALQLCAGQESGIEAAVHAMRVIFEHEDTDAVLLVDAKNAFNNLNRQTALRNIEVSCPSISCILTNLYRSSAPLYVGSETLLSREGTTQGDPLAMAMYALASVPLIRRISTDGTTQAWYADDATGGGRLARLAEWWTRLSTHGPSYGYFVNPPKTWLIVKPDLADEARRVFDNFGIEITATGSRHLGAALGTRTFVDQYVQQKVEKWVSEVQQLAKVARTQPHAAYCAYTHGLAGRWTYLARTIPGIASLFAPLEAAVHQEFLPALLGRAPPGNLERELLALPARLGGLGLIDPTKLCDDFDLSVKVSAPLTALIIQQSPDLGDTPQTLQQAKYALKRDRAKKIDAVAEDVRRQLARPFQRAVELASEKGASTWLTALPTSAHGFELSKAAFRDAVHLRYGWRPERLPSHCACGRAFDVSHALSCPTGGFPTIRHNELRDLCATLLTEVCSGVSIEPTLQALDGEALPSASNTSAEARSDISANGFWGGRFERTLFDVRVFNPNVPSNLSSQIPTLYRRHERLKRSAYEARICDVEHASFTPLIWSTSGGAGPSATMFLKRLAGKLADKREDSYSAIMGWLRCRFGFAMLRSSLMCLRGARSSLGRPVSDFSIARAEARYDV